MAKLDAIAAVELVGLPTAIEFADSALKAASVKLIGYEYSKGSGLVTVKLSGDVGAIKAAVEAGCICAEAVGRVWSKIIIPRPSRALEMLIFSKETVGPAHKPQVLTEAEAQEAEVQEDEAQEAESEEAAAQEEEAAQQDEEEAEQPVNEELDREREISCNLCNDLACRRKKGEPKSSCIHFND